MGRAPAGDARRRWSSSTSRSCAGCSTPATGPAEILTRGRGYELRIAARRRRRVPLRAARRRGRARARRSRCGAARRWPTSRTSRSPRPRSGAWRSCGCARSSRRSTPIWPTGAHRELVGELEALVAEHPLQRAPARPADARAVSLRAPGGRARGLPHARATLVEQIGVEPGPRAARAARGDPAPGRVRSTGRRRAELPAELEALDAARSGATRARAAARGVGSEARAGRGGVVGRRRARRAAAARGWPPSWPARCTGRARACSTARARAGSRPDAALLVLDDVDPAQPAGLARAARRDARARRRHDDRAGAGRRDAEHVARAARRRRRRGDRRAVRARRGRDPAAELAARSGGLPGARASARRRVGARGGGAPAARGGRPGAAERVGLRRAEQRLAGDVVELQACASAPALGRGARPTVVCPFKGLAPFDVDDAPFFFGRERLVGRDGRAARGRAAAGRRRAVGQRQVLGAARRAAGRARRRRPARAARRGRRRCCAPASTRCEPSRRAAAAETAAPAGRRRPVRGALHALPRRGRARRRSSTRSLAARAGSDRWSSSPCAPTSTAAAASIRELGAAARRQPRARRPDAARRAAPRDRAARRSARACASSPSSSTGCSPTSRPSRARCRCCPRALLELWEQRDGRHLRLAAYERTGGVRGAVARLAEAAVRRPRPRREQRGRARDPAAARRRGRRRRRRAPARARSSELDADRERRPARARRARRRPARHALARTASRSRTRRCCASGRACAAGSRRTPRAGACTTTSPSRRASGRPAGATPASSTAARAWPRRSTGAPRTGAELNAARARVPRTRAAPRPTARRRRARRANRRLRVAARAASAPCSVIALRRRRAVPRPARHGARRGAHRAKRSASARRRWSRRTSTARCCWRARASRSTTRLQTRGNLLAALLRSPAAVGVTCERGRPAAAHGAAPRRPHVAVGDNRGRVLVLDVSGGGPARVMRRVTLAENRTWPAPVAAVIDLEFSPDGSRLAVSGRASSSCSTGAAGGGSRRRQVPRGLVHATSPSRPTAACCTRPTRGCSTAPVRLDHAPLRGPRRATASAGPSGSRPRRAHAGSARVRRRRPPARHPRGRRAGAARRARRCACCTALPGPRVFPDAQPAAATSTSALPDSIALAPDGATLAAGGQDGSVRFLDLRTGATATASGRHDGAVTGVAVHGRQRLPGHDRRRRPRAGLGRRAARGQRDARGPRRARARGRRGRARAHALHRGPRQPRHHLGSRRRPAPRAAVRRRQRRRGSRRTVLPSPAISGDGRTLATTPARRRERDRHPHARAALACPVRGARSPDVQRARVRAPTAARRRGLDGFLALVDPRSGRIHARLRGHRDVVFTPTSTARAAPIVTTGLDGTLRLWDGAQPAARSARRSASTALPAPRRIAPDGARSPCRWSAAPSTSSTSRVPSAARAPARRRAVRRSPPLLARRRAAARRQRRRPRAVVLHDGLASAGRRVSRRTTASSRRVDASPDGRTFVTAGSDGQVRLWDRATAARSARRCPGRKKSTPPRTSRRTATTSRRLPNGRGYRWDVRPAAWERHACNVAGRRLTRAEWHAALPDRPLRAGVLKPTGGSRRAPVTSYVDHSAAPPASKFTAGSN